MNLKYSNKASEIAFVEAFNETSVVRNWLIQKLGCYCLETEQSTLEIMIDPWSKTEKPSFAWGIYKEEMDEYGVISGSEKVGIINGGLIYRGKSDNDIDTYSSHT